MSCIGRWRRQRLNFGRRVTKANGAEESDLFARQILRRRAAALSPFWEACVVARRTEEGSIGRSPPSALPDKSRSAIVSVEAFFRDCRQGRSEIEVGDYANHRELTEIKMYLAPQL